MITKRTRIVFKGGKTTLEELAKEYNMNYATLFFRYRRGLRDEDLVKEIKRVTNATYYIDGKPYRMTPDEKVRRVKLKVNTEEIQARLNIGMSMDEALNFGRKYVTKFGYLCYEIHGQESTYYIPIEDIQELREHDISTHYISRNVMIVDDISELLLENTRVYEEDIYLERSYEEQAEEERRRKKIQEYKEAKYREEHPHLFDGTPQKHGESEYAKYLADSYTFACSDVSK
ncbi:SA1788 family PVL leukocidin-associated protein [Staphylococcus aureus]